MTDEQFGRFSWKMQVTEEEIQEYIYKYWLKDYRIQWDAREMDNLVKTCIKIKNDWEEKLGSSLPGQEICKIVDAYNNNYRIEFIIYMYEDEINCRMDKQKQLDNAQKQINKWEEIKEFFEKYSLPYNTYKKMTLIYKHNIETDEQSMEDFMYELIQKIEPIMKLIKQRLTSQEYKKQVVDNFIMLLFQVMQYRDIGILEGGMKGLLYSIEKDGKYW